MNIKQTTARAGVIPHGNPTLFDRSLGRHLQYAYVGAADA